MISKKIIGHRGLPTLAPENTIASFEAARLSGSQWIETDIGITEDEVLVLMHDDYLDRTTSLTGPLSENSWGDIQNASAGYWFGEEFKNEPVPSLDQLISYANKYGININFELKSVIGKDANALADVLVEKFYSLIKKLDPKIDIIVSSFNPIMLMKFRQLDSDTRVAVLFEEHTLYEDWILIMQALNADIIHPQNEGLTKEKIKEMKSYNYEVNVWSVDDRNRANELFNWGADGVFSNKSHMLNGVTDRSL